MTEPNETTSGMQVGNVTFQKIGWHDFTAALKRERDDYKLAAMAEAQLADERGKRIQHLESEGWALCELVERILAGAQFGKAFADWTEDALVEVTHWRQAMEQEREAA